MGQLLKRKEMEGKERKKEGKMKTRTSLEKTKGNREIKGKGKNDKA